jgi:hypothetical protein
MHNAQCPCTTLRVPVINDGSRPSSTQSSTLFSPGLLFPMMKDVSRIASGWNEEHRRGKRHYRNAMDSPGSASCIAFGGQSEDQQSYHHPHPSQVFLLCSLSSSPPCQCPRYAAPRCKVSGLSVLVGAKGRWHHCSEFALHPSALLMKLSLWITYSFVPRALLPF